MSYRNLAFLPLFWAGLVAILIAPGLAFAEEPFRWPSLSTAPQVENANPNDVAVIIAIEDYAFLPNIPGARENATDWEIFFRRGLGMRNVYTLVDRDATREAMLRYARQAAEEVGEGGTIWYLFIGHGTPLDRGQDGGIVGMDALQNIESLEARSLSQDELLTILNSGRQGQTVLAIDACFSGRAPDGQALAQGIQPVVPVQVEPRLQSSDSAKTVVLSAARADQYAGPLPGMERPAFSFLLLGALRGWANDGSDAVTVDDALLWVRQQLRGVPGRQQTPEFFGPGEIVLTRGVTERDPFRVWEEEIQLREQERREREQAEAAEQERLASERERIANERREAARLAEIEREVLRAERAERRTEFFSGRRIASIGLLTAGGGLLIGSGVVTAQAVGTRGTIDGGELTQREGVDAIDRYNGHVITATVLGAAGLVATGVGAYLWVSESRDQRLSLQLSPEGTSLLTFSGTW